VRSGSSLDGADGRIGWLKAERRASGFLRGEVDMSGLDEIFAISLKCGNAPKKDAFTAILRYFPILV
jgi:hypothetical protein